MMLPRSVDLARAAAPLGSVDLIDLAGRIGALHLMPENGSNRVRLQLASSAVSTIKTATNGSILSNQELRSWLSSEPFSDRRIRSMEDPPANPFTETIVFLGESYTVVPGGLEFSASQLQTLLDAIFADGRFKLPLSQRFVLEARELAQAALAMAAESSKRAGLQRVERPSKVATPKIVQPRGRRERLLQGAVTFSVSELTTLFARHGQRLHELAALSVDGGDSSPNLVEIDNLPSYQRPILKLGECFVLVAPSSLPGALMHALLSMASEFGDLPAVAERWRITSFERVDGSLTLLGCARLIGPFDSTDPELPAIAAVYRLDNDKVLNLLLLSDPLEEFDANVVAGDWPMADLNERVATEIRGLEERLALGAGTPNELLSLVGYATPGRTFGLGLGNSLYARSLLFSSEDLETIAHTSSRRLILWQFAKASDRIRESAKVMAFDPLDEFAFWKSNGFSYYMSDEGRPSGVLITPGTALDLRIEARDRLDTHTLPAPRGHERVEVMRFQNRDVPIYVAVAGSVETFALSVEGLPLTLWVVAGRRVVDPRFSSLMLGLVDLVAYWIWQFKSHLNETLERLAGSFESFVIEVDLTETEAWFTEGTPSNEILEVDRVDRGVRFTFLDGAVSLFEGADNDGERQFVRALLDTLHELGRDAAGALDHPTAGAVAQAIESYAPLGQKKKLTILDGNNGVLLDESGLPPYRPLQPAVTEEWRDREHEMLARLDLQPGPIPRAERERTLKRTVADVFSLFEKSVAALSPDKLLETLVAREERLIQKEEQDRRLNPTKVACYGSASAMVEELTRDGPILATTSIAHRFVIEYVVARPPHGLRPMSLEAYDQLISLAALLASWGLQCDAIHYGLADTELSVLESGRLGSLAHGYDAATADYGKRSYAEQFQRSVESFSAMFDSSVQPSGAPLISELELEAASKEELGLGFGQIAHFIELLSEVGSRQPGPAKRTAMAEVRESSASDLGWPVPVIDSAISLLALRPREEFLVLPPGFALRDVFPWAFNRRLSHLGRPLLVKASDNGSEELIWGERSLLRSHEYLLRQFVGGRWNARSDLMRKLQGRVTRHSGEAFNNRVAEAFEEIGRLTVRRRVSSIGGQPLERKRGQPLGDVDVLVLDPSSREVLLIETKDFAGARTPAEFANEVRKVSDALEIHAERDAWVRSRVRDLLAWLDVDQREAETWQVRQMVVVSGELFTHGLRDLPVPVVTLATLRAQLSQVAAS